MPQLALGADEVLAQEWRHEPGEAFAEGDILLEVETDKATMEVEAPFAGVLVAQLCAPGEVVAVGATIGYAVEPGEDVRAAQAEFAARGDETSAAPAPVPVPQAVAAVPELAQPVAPNGAAVIAFVGVEDGALAGLRAGSPAPAAERRTPMLDDPALAGPFVREPLSRRRTAIARRMAAATDIPSFVVQRDIVTEPAREAVAAARARGERATFTDVLLHAVGVTASAHPAANAWIVDGDVLAFAGVGVSLAVDTPAGVMAPVIRGVEALSLGEIAVRRADLVDRAREGQLDARELTGGTITLSNVAGLGAHGIVPVLTAPQVAALGVGAARQTFSGEAISVVFVGDHRQLDGADGARFLATFADALRADPRTRED
jgi:pyruvate dehydrogenase E2 component (dihydrolipoamide acetyltransferase)